MEDNCLGEGGSKVKFAIIQCLGNSDDDGKFEAIMIELALIDKLITMYRILAYMYSTK